jgi:hypothetical protein
MDPMDQHEPVPENDAQEQPESPDGPSVDLPGDLGEKPKADVLEQALPVQRERVRKIAPAHDDVPEADWLEQSVVEPLDEDEPR